ncbi:MAG: TonB-dependent receptor plug domain-containing protein, partial [Gammaproteobacteria bacterium]
MAPDSALPTAARGLRGSGILVFILAWSLASPLRAAIIEEIVVTATKREESAQDIPISVTAFSEEMIQTLGFNQSYDIASHVANFQFMAEASPSTPFIFLRGIGNTSFFPSSINPVAIYVDQAYV